MGMYAKLMSRITESSLMEQEIGVRYCFLMMLAMADPQGYVVGTDIAIARRMNIPVESFKAFVAELMKPDIDSNSKEMEGRRVIESDCERGYFLVNYRKYRDTRDEEDRRKYMREYMQKYRKPNDLGSDVNSGKQGKQNLTVLANAEEEAKADVPVKAKTSVPIEPPSGDVVESEYSQDFESFWKSYPRKTGKGNAWKAWNGAKKRPPLEVLTAAVDLQKETEQWRRDNGKYIPHPATWLNGRRWQDEVDLKLGVSNHEPKHKAYNHEDATRGKTVEEICNF